MAAVCCAVLCCTQLRLCSAVMCHAGELLQSERDALLKLIQSLRHEYEAVQLAKQGQESELQGLKVRCWACGYQ